MLFITGHFFRLVFKSPVNDQVKDLVGSSVKSVVLAPGNAQVVVHLHHDALHVHCIGSRLMFELHSTDSYLLVGHPNRSSNNITAIDRISSYLKAKFEILNNS